MDFITGFGRADSQRPPEKRGLYLTGTYQNIVELAKSQLTAEPCHTDKDGWWCVFVNQNHPDMRSARWLRSVDSMLGDQLIRNTCLWMDIDEGDPSFDYVVQFARAVANGHAFLVYTSRSNGEVRLDGTTKRKYRIIWPHVTELPTTAYNAFAQMLSNTARAWGLVPDPVAERPAQICYLPSAGPEYNCHVEEGPHMDLGGEHHHWLWNGAMAIFQEQEHSYKEFMGRAETSRSFRAAFARAHPCHSIMEAAGFQSYDGDNFHHQDQDTKSYGTKLDADGRGWVTSSGTVEQQVGRKNGDAYDLAVTYLFATEAEAEAYARQCLANEDNARYGAATSGGKLEPEYDELGMFLRDENGRQVYRFELLEDRAPGNGWDLWSSILAEQQARQQRHEEAQKEAMQQYQLAADKGFSKFTILGPLTGFIGRVSDYVNDHYMFYDQPELSKLAAITAAAAFVGRKDSFDEAAPVFNCLGLGITGIGKDVVDSFLNKVLDELEARYPDFTGGTLDAFRPISKPEGVKAYNDEISRRISTVMVLPESGMANDSKAGDAKKVKAFIMTNIAAGAYRWLRFTNQSNALHRVHGTQHSIFEESTMEAYRKHLTGEAHDTGEAARRLFYRFDVSRGNTKGRQRNSQIPVDIMDGFFLLAKEALRGEDASLTPGQDHVIRPGLIPIAFTDRQLYQPDQYTSDRLNQLVEETRQNRSENTENSAGVSWGHKSGRHILLLRQLSVLFARTDRVVYHPKSAPVVGEAHFRTAEMLVKASQVTEAANAENFGNPLDAVCEAVWETCMNMFATGEPTKKYLKECGASRDAYALFSERKVPWSLVTSWRHASIRCDELAQGSYTKVKVWRDVLTHGDSSGLHFWEMEPIGKKSFVTINTEKRG